MAARTELKSWIDREGRRQADLARELGVSEVRLHRLLRGTGSLPPAALTALERLTGISDLAVRLASDAPKSRAPRTRPRPSPRPASVELPLAEVVPIRPPPEPVPDGDLEALATTMAESLGSATARPLVKVKLQIALGAKSEAVRSAAASDLLDRLVGRAVQKTLDLTPKPPATDPELMELFDKILEGTERERQRADEELVRH